MTVAATPGKSRAAATRPITLAVSALGGQGGGVLADWIVAAAERSGHLAQSTSVPGVAQRTGATVYYLELFPLPARRESNTDPVLALMPVPGDVDVVVAAELMEAGRAILRGIVTPDRTTLVASTHRVFAVSEKAAMGDGVADPDKVMAAARKASRSLIAFDMDAVGQETRSVISAVLFGALAGSGALPFERSAYEDAIRASGVQVEANLAGFARGFDRARGEAAVQAVAAGRREPQSAAGKRLAARIQSQFPVVLQETLMLGAAKLLDYQDEAYADLYLDRLQPIAALEARAGDPRLAYILTAEVGRYLALWMAYEDVIRVSDLKVRTSRFARVREEVRAEAGQIVHVLEFMHPRLIEIAEAMPAGFGRFLLSDGVSRLLQPLFRRGRQVRVTTVKDFLLLSFIASWRKGRRGTLRYAQEQARIEAWLQAVKAAAPADYDLAVEIAACARLIKGYGDTHARGLRNFERIMLEWPRLTGAAGAAVMAKLVRAALADEAGAALETALAELNDPAPLAAE
jgi:indolepyruvate ferredoxin oxidoreductase beta subunit